MATMISVLATDADVDARTLDRILRHAADESYHQSSDDGDTSTNDSMLALTSGVGGACDEALLAQAFREVAGDLARMIVCDSEGFERSLSVRGSGAATKADALRVAETVASSLLVRTAITGGDPNWGRIVAAAGRAGVAFRPNDPDLSLRRNQSSPPLGRSERHQKFGSVSLGEFNRSTSHEAGPVCLQDRSAKTPRL